MIYNDSRYATGILAKSYDARSSSVKVSVFRDQDNESAEFYYYTWTARDRMDILAHETLGSADLWWKIMDYNPEITDAFSIPIGTSLRIPNVF